MSQSVMCSSLDASGGAPCTLGVYDWPMAQEPTELERTAKIQQVLRRAAFMTSGAGIAFGVLTLMAWSLLMGARDNLITLVEADADYEVGASFGVEVAGLYLLPFAAIAFLWFIVALRGWIRGTQQRRNLLISDLQLGAGAVFTALFLVGAGAIATAIVVAQTESDQLTAESLLALSGFGSTVVTVMGIRMAAIFVIATASLGMTTGVLPRWFNLTSYAFGIVLMLTPVVATWLAMAFPLWVIVLSLALLVHIARLKPEELPGYAARYAMARSEEAGSSLDD